MEKNERRRRRRQQRRRRAVAESVVAALFNALSFFLLFSPLTDGLELVLLEPLPARSKDTLV